MRSVLSCLGLLTVSTLLIAEDANQKKGTSKDVAVTSTAQKPSQIKQVGVIMIYMHLRHIRIKPEISYGTCWLPENYISMAIMQAITKPRFICQEF